MSQRRHWLLVVEEELGGHSIIQRILLDILGKTE